MRIKDVVIPTEIRLWILDLLVDASSSVAAIYLGLRRHYSLSDRISIDYVIGVVEEMAQGGWISLYQVHDDGSMEVAKERDLAVAREAYGDLFCRGDPVDASVDEIGLWCRIEPRGRTLWSAWAERVPGERRSRWTLHQDDLRKVISVVAEDVASGEEAIRTWKQLNPLMSVREDTRRITYGEVFVSADGAMVDDWVRLEYSFTMRPE